MVLAYLLSSSLKNLVFLVSLRRILESAPMRNYIFFLGDFNADMGINSSTSKGLMGGRASLHPAQCWSSAKLGEKVMSFRLGLGIGL